MENQEENSEPPGPRTRRACKAMEAANLAAEEEEEQRIFDECPHVMMVGDGQDEEVRQRAADRIHDEGRHQLDAILEHLGRGELNIIKKEVEEEEEGPVGRGQELDALQKGGEVGEGDVSIKEESSEGEEKMLEVNTARNHMLAEGQAVAIPANLFQELEVKEEEVQDEGVHLAISGGGCGGEGTTEQRHKNLKLSGQQLFTRKNFPDDARKYTSRNI